MKIKRYIEYIECKHTLNENVNYDSKEKVLAWLESANIENYTINENLSVDVNGNVDISEWNLTRIPIKFNNVTGDFNCMSNMLSTLNNIPKYITGGFSVYSNILTTLVGGPEYVGGWFSCSKNKLETLIGCPKRVDNIFYCRNNKLKDLKGFTNNVGDKLDCKNNPNMISLNGLNEDFDLNKLICNNNTLIWNWLESILSENETNISYNINWIKNNKNTMPKTFEEKFGYLLEFEHYTKTFKK